MPLRREWMARLTPVYEFHATFRPEFFRPSRGRHTFLRLGFYKLEDAGGAPNGTARDDAGGGAHLRHQHPLGRASICRGPLSILWREKLRNPCPRQPLHVPGLWQRPLGNVVRK